MVTFERSAMLEWTGPVVGGSGQVAAGSGAFQLSATFPRLAGEPEGTTTPEELLAASHATCFGIGLRSVLAKRGAVPARIRVTSRLTAEKGGGLIRLVSAHLDAVVEDSAGMEAAALDEAARVAEQACTISAVLRASMPVTVTVVSA